MVYTVGYGTARTTLRESAFNKPKAKPKELKMIVEFIFENKGKNETSDLVEPGNVEIVQKVFLYGFP